MKMPVYGKMLLNIFEIVPPNKYLQRGFGLQKTLFTELPETWYPVTIGAVGVEFTRSRYRCLFPG